MLDILEEFHKGNATREDLEAELETWNRIVEDYEADDVYVGDQYYQDALGTRGAIQEAIATYDTPNEAST